MTDYACASPQRRQEHKKLGGITVLHRDNATRLISGYIMLQTMLRNQDVVDVCGVRHSALDEDHLHPNAWNQLADGISIMEPFQSATLRVEDDCSKLHNSLVELNFLRTTFASIFQKYQMNPLYHILSAAVEGIIVSGKYRDICKSLTVCVSAVVLICIQHTNGSFSRLQSQRWNGVKMTFRMQSILCKACG